MNNFEAIPLELRLLPQWCVWSYEDTGSAKSTKVPYNPLTKSHADVTNPATWCSFEQACAAKNYSGIGFIFSPNDQYSFIDLDDTNGDQVSLDRQIKIYREFDSYSEISPSGKGLHIIVKGVVPQGRRRSHIEIYSSQRYATMTGNVYNNKGIIERQSMLMQLWDQMGAGAPATYLYKGDDSEKQSDKEIIEQAESAVNGDKFKQLYSGKWQDIYQSQSEADYAIINIISFYTQNKKQIERIFYSSQLGRRDKAKRKDYLSWMINKSFDRMLPSLDFDGFKISLENAIKANSTQLEQSIAGSSNGKTADFESVNNGSNPLSASNASIAQLAEPTAHNRSDVGSTPTASTIRLPPGLLGEIAQFIYQAAPRPVPEIALAAAIGLMAGICGRAYNISGTGLNQYILLLAATGTGKESMALGIDRLMNTIRMQVPTSSRFIGPSEIASGQALIKHLSKSSPCFVSILGEFGLRLEAMSSPNANSAEKALKRMLLDLYNKSGHGQVFRPSIFADAEKNIASTDSPSFSILGESTPERFYTVLNEDMISEGLLPRFMLVEYNGMRPALSKWHLQATPSIFLIEQFAALVANAESIMYQKKVINIISTEEAASIFEKFDIFADKQINETNKEVLRQLWNRAHIKALKIAGLIAVGVNMNEPVVLPDYVNWAIEMVTNDIKSLSAKFEAGEIGKDNDELKQINEVKRVMLEYVERDWKYVRKYCERENMHKDSVIPYGYINKRLAATSSFKKDTTKSLWRALKSLCDIDAIREVPKQDLVAKFGCVQRSFIITNISLVRPPSSN